MAEERLSIVVELKNAVEAALGLRDVGKAAGDTGKSAEGTGKGFGGLAKNLAVAAGGTLAIKKWFSFLKGAADDATKLARSTAGLTRQTGMDAQTSSAWVSMAKARGIELKQLQVSFTAFSKQLSGFEQGSKGATRAFEQLGIPPGRITGTADGINQVADAFQKMPAGADKSALAVKLFGKQGLALLPLLNLGSEGLQEQMKVMQKHGLTMDEAGVKKGLALAKTQRDLKVTTDGLKTSIGSALLPVLTSLAQAVLPIVQKFSELVRGSGALQAILPVLAIALAAIVVVAKLVAIATGLAAAGATAMWTALGIGIVIGVIAALVLAYTKVSWFRDAVNAAWGAIKTAVGALVEFVKSNWQTILTVVLATLGPVGLVIAAFIRFRSQIFGAVSTVVSKLGEIPRFVSSIPGKIAGAVSGMWNGLTSGVSSAVDTVINTLKKIIDTAKSVVDTVKSTLSDVGSAASSAVSDIPVVGGLLSSLQYGGTVGPGGTLALVGEAGPELLQLPGGARVTPLQEGTQPPVALGGLGGDIHVHLEVDGRELAQVVAAHTAEQQARR